MIELSVCSAKVIEVLPVQVLQSVTGQPFAVQKVRVTDHGGNLATLSFHLEEGCLQLAAGKPVVIPKLAEAEEAAA